MTTITKYEEWMNAIEKPNKTYFTTKSIIDKMLADYPLTWWQLLNMDKVMNYI